MKSPREAWQWGVWAGAGLIVLASGGVALPASFLTLGASLVLGVAGLLMLLVSFRPMLARMNEDTWRSRVAIKEAKERLGKPPDREPED